MNAEGFQVAPQQALVPLAAVLQITGYGRSAAYAAMADFLLPRPVKVGRASRWPAHEVMAVREAIARGDDESARRALVRQLRSQRGGALVSVLRS